LSSVSLWRTSFLFNNSHTAFLELVHSIGYDDGGGAPIYIGLSYNSAAEWEHPDGSSLVYVRWWRTDLDTTGSLANQFPAGNLSTRRRTIGYMWVSPITSTHPFVCQVAPITNGGK
jgi:hypothetical protein